MAVKSLSHHSWMQAGVFILSLLFGFIGIETQGTVSSVFICLSYVAWGSLGAMIGWSEIFWFKVHEYVSLPSDYAKHNREKEWKKKITMTIIEIVFVIGALVARYSVDVEIFGRFIPNIIGKGTHTEAGLTIALELTGLVLGWIAGTLLVKFIYKLRNDEDAGASFFESNQIEETN